MATIGTLVRVKHGRCRNLIGTLIGINRAADLWDIETDAGRLTGVRADFVVPYVEPKHRSLRRTLPYGMWTTDEGREVLFDRDYWPIWERRPGGVALQADRNEWIKGIITTIHFWAGSDRAPWFSAETRRQCDAVLAAWGVADQHTPAQITPGTHWRLLGHFE